MRARELSVMIASYFKGFMNIKTYNLITIAPPLIFLFILYVLQNEYLSNYFVLPKSTLLFVTLSKSFIALFTFLSGIYFFRSNIPKGKKLTGPVWSIFMGVLFIALSYGPTFFSYKMIYGMPISTLESQHIRGLKDAAVNPNRSVEDRRICARMIYVDTGEEIKIMGKKGNIVFFEPNSTEILKRQSTIETNQSHINLLSFIKKAFVYQVFLLFIVFGGFILLLKKIPPKLLVVKDLQKS